MPSGKARALTVLLDIPERGQLFTCDNSSGRCTAGQSRGAALLVVAGAIDVGVQPVVPLHHREDLYRTLLELNATEMMHGAYGIEGESIVISDALQLENLDFNEFAASVDDITLAVASHHSRLTKFQDRDRDSRH